MSSSDETALTLPLDAGSAWAVVISTTARFRHRIFSSGLLTTSKRVSALAARGTPRVMAAGTPTPLGVRSASARVACQDANERTRCASQRHPGRG